MILACDTGHRLGAHPWSLPMPTARPATASHPTAPPLQVPPEGPAAAAAARHEMGIDALQQFKALMVEDGQPVQVARMFSDRLYAYERIACAHASAHPGLRRLALALFQCCHQADERRRALS